MGVLSPDASFFLYTGWIEYNQSVVCTTFVVSPFLVITERSVAGLGPAVRIERLGMLIAIMIIFSKLACNIIFLYLRC